MCELIIGRREFTTDSWRERIAKGADARVSGIETQSDGYKIEYELEAEQPEALPGFPKWLVPGSENAA